MNNRNRFPLAFAYTKQEGFAIILLTYFITGGSDREKKKYDKKDGNVSCDDDRFVWVR